jgi:hypothetical protein
MTPTFKLAAAAGALAAALAGSAWSQPSTTAAPKSTLPSANSVMSGTTASSKDPYDPSNTQLRAQCFDQTTGRWKATAQCAVFERNGIPPDVVEGGTPINSAGTTGSTSSLNSNAGMSGSTSRSTAGTASTSSLNPSMSSSGTTGPTSGSTSAGTTGGTSGATTGGTSGSAGTSGSSGGTGGGGGH